MHILHGFSANIFQFNCSSYFGVHIHSCSFFQVYLNLEPGNIIVCSGRSLGKTVQVKLVNFETTQTVAREGTQIKGSYNFDYAGKANATFDPLCVFPYVLFALSIYSA